MFKKSFESQLQHYSDDTEQKRDETTLEELVAMGKNIVEDMREGKRELENLKAIRESLTNEEYVRYLEKAHGKPMKEEIEHALSKVETQYHYLIERQKEGAEIMKEQYDFLMKLRARISDLKANKERFYEDLLTILNENELPNKDRV